MGIKFDQYNPIYSDNNNKEDSKTENTPEAKKKTTQPKKEKGPGKIRTFFSDGRVKAVIGVALFFFALYLLFSCISYLFNGAADQSLVENNGIIENARSNEIKNAGGPAGASVSELLFNKGFGIGAFFIIYLLFAVSMKLFNRYKARMASTIIICLVATVTVSSVVGLVTLDNSLFFSPGGYHGRYLNEFLISVIGIYGTVFVNIFLIALLTALSFNSLKRMYLKFKEMRAKKRAAEIEARRKEAEENKNIFDEPETQPESDGTENKPEPVSIDFVPEKMPADESENKTTEDHPEDEAFSDSAAITNKVPQPIPCNADEIDMIVKVNKIEKADDVAEKPFDPTAELSRYKFPPLSLLRDIPNNTKSVDVKEQEENKERITKTLKDYGIAIKSIKVCVGPTVTLYEIIPAEGVRIAKIKNLEDDIALSLAALGIRIIAPIPGKGTIGIEVPNKEKQTVAMRAIIESRKFQESKYELPIALGSTISNDVFIADLTKMPHILVAGATGQGKSVGLNAIVTSLLYKKHPSELKFVMIDPKMVEFSMYSKLEYHYIAKLAGEEECIVTDMHKAVATLNSLVGEMENRLLLLRDANARNIIEYNEKYIAHHLNPDKGHKYLPYIVVIIDELADLIMNIGRKEVETPIARITQKARAVGIHMILATQRPSTDIITGVIKANCPGRIAFRVTQMVDSRTILDRSGAQQLIGRGDMLITYNNELTRVQCAFVDTPEVEAIVNYIDGQVGFDEAYELPEYTPETAEGNGGNSGSLGSISDRDPLFEEAAAFIVSGGNTASTSSLQRRYSIGYNRAGKIMDQMEAAGIVGPSSGGKPRQVLIDSIQLTQMLNN